MSEKKYIFRNKYEKLRLDKFLSIKMESLSRSLIQSLIKNKRVKVNNILIDDSNYKTKENDIIELKLTDPKLRTSETQSVTIKIIYEDDSILVIDKNPGILTHRSDDNNNLNLVDVIQNQYNIKLAKIGGSKRPGIVHRLDKDTSGLLVMAKTDEAHVALAHDFGLRNIKRTYTAVVWSVPIPKKGKIDSSIGKDKSNWRKMKVDSKGKYSLTNYLVTNTFKSLASIVDCNLSTGRTHQIRVHMLSIGCPVIGDQLYSRGRNTPQGINEKLNRTIKDFKRQALHAKILGFKHPVNKKELVFKSMIPYDIKKLVKCLKEEIN